EDPYERNDRLKTLGFDPKLDKQLKKEKQKGQCKNCFTKRRLSEIDEEIKVSLYIFIQKIETDKSLIQVIITTLLKKIIKPEQDMRLHNVNKNKHFHK
ncbi:MAG: hypothetical protein ACK5QV_19500, partial [Dolichospermum sp.]